MIKKRRLHLGCGLNTPEGWINLDGSWNVWLAKCPVVRKVFENLAMLPKSRTTIPWNPGTLIHDLRKPLPFVDNSLLAINASHVLEHLYLEEARRLLKGCFQVLEPGGVLRVVVPNLEAIILEYMEADSFDDSRRVNVDANDSRPISRADRLNQQLLLRAPQPTTGNILYKIYTGLKDFHSHKWMYDAESLTYYFQQAGFVEVQEMACHQSRIDGIEKIELPERVLNGAGICIEGVKPDYNCPAKFFPSRSEVF
jgi:SAM-dependent methyltransferase